MLEVEEVCGALLPVVLLDVKEVPGPLLAAGEGGVPARLENVGELWKGLRVDLTTFPF